mmetsp:Transcript_43759/g.71640  ORF Transcript_43759/g.71640 Transcript_43759/m.71640 type:complete len:81 (+) Transcript_43759:1935-2177(+)
MGARRRRRRVGADGKVASKWRAACDNRAFAAQLVEGGLQLLNSLSPVPNPKYYDHKCKYTCEPKPPYYKHTCMYTCENVI